MHPKRTAGGWRELNGSAAGHCAAGRYEAAVPLFEQVVAGCAAGSARTTRTP